jgi:hypothetical protein
MKTKSIISIFTLLVLVVVFTSCKKKKSTASAPASETVPIASTRTVKYEITGNYTGHLMVVINSSGSVGGGNEIITVTSLPWTKTVEFANTTLGVGIGANAVIGQLGVQGQTASIKIYNGTNVVQSGNGVTGADGILILPTLAYVFP